MQRLLLLLALCLPACSQPRPEAFALGAEGRAFLQQIHTRWREATPVDPKADARLLSARFRNSYCTIYLLPDGTYFEGYGKPGSPGFSTRGRWTLGGGLVTMRPDGEPYEVPALLVRGDPATPARMFLVRWAELGSHPRWIEDWPGRLADHALERAEPIRRGDVYALRSRLLLENRRLFLETGPMRDLPR